MRTRYFTINRLSIINLIFLFIVFLLLNSCLTTENKSYLPSERLTQFEVDQVRQSLFDYKMDCDNFPSSKSGLSALYPNIAKNRCVKFSGRYISKNILEKKLVYKNLKDNYQVSDDKDNVIISSEVSKPPSSVHVFIKKNNQECLNDESVTKPLMEILGVSNKAEFCIVFSAILQQLFVKKKLPKNKLKMFDSDFLEKHVSSNLFQIYTKLKKGEPLGENKGGFAQTSVELTKGKNIKVGIKLSPLHKYLGEYTRQLILTDSKGQSEYFEMAKAVGGFWQTNLYQAKTGEILIQGYIDCWGVDLSSGAFLISANPVKGRNFCRTKDFKYLGSFDFKDEEWIFSSSIPEKMLFRK